MVPLDNPPDPGQLGTHKHSKVKRWLAARPRYQVHYTHLRVLVKPNRDMVNIITQKAIRQGSPSLIGPSMDRIDK